MPGENTPMGGKLSERATTRAMQVGDVDEGEIVGAFTITVILKDVGGTLPDAGHAAEAICDKLEADLKTRPHVVRVETEAMALQSKTEAERARSLTKMLLESGLADGLPDEVKQLLAKLGTGEDEEELFKIGLDEFLDQMKSYARTSPWEGGR